MIKVCCKRSELYLETGLKDVCAATVNRRRYFTILNDRSDIVKHETGFFIEIPIQTGGEVGLFSPSDSLVVQVYKGEASRHFPGSPSPLTGMKLALWL